MGRRLSLALLQPVTSPRPLTPRRQRVALHNPYSHDREFKLQSSRPDLVSFKDASLYVPAGEQRYIGLRFAADMGVQPGDVDILLFINDRDDKNEECMLLRARFVRDSRRTNDSAAVSVGGGPSAGLVGE